MVATCSDEMLPVHAADRNLSRYTGESPDNFRSRIAMYEEVCQLGGLNEGIILAVKALGYTNPVIRSARDFKGDTTRWAEFYLIIVMNVDEEHPIAFSILRKTVRQWKEVEAKDNYYMEYKTEVKEPHTGAFQRVDYKKFIYFYDYLKLDGKWQLDGSHLLDAVVHGYPTRIGYLYRSRYEQHSAGLSMASFRNKHTLITTVSAKMGFRVYANYFEGFYLKTDGKWQLDGSHTLDALIYNGDIRWSTGYRVEHEQNIRIKQRYRARSVSNRYEISRENVAYRLTIDFFEYLKLNGLWNLTGSRMMDSQRVEHPTKQSYKTAVHNKENLTVTWHEEHNLFFLDGTWSLDGSKIIDAYQKTEVM
ncbi:hypothetical protein [Agathobacter rectalis]|uniref:hypothetical protein n=1 Tax=Agathobacter rectalis TaxID=39491 RepID=UPI003ED84E0B